jgi:hypothetical protein
MTEDHRYLEQSEPATGAKVTAVPKSELVSIIPPDVKRVRLREDPFVAIRRTQDDREHVTCN